MTLSVSAGTVYVDFAAGTATPLLSFAYFKREVSDAR